MDRDIGTGNETSDTSAPFGEVNAQGSTQTAARGAAEDVTQEAKERALEVRDEALRQAKRVGEDVRRQLSGSFDESKNEISRQIDGVARGIRRSSSSFRGDNQALFADYGDRLAEGIETMSDYLRDRDAETLWSDVQGAARNKPGLFYGGLLAVGILGAQLLKSAARTRAASAYQGASDPRYGATGSAAGSEGRVTAPRTGTSRSGTSRSGASAESRPVRSYDRKIVTADDLDKSSPTQSASTQSAREGDHDGK